MTEERVEGDISACITGRYAPLHLWQDRPRDQDNFSVFILNTAVLADHIQPPELTDNPLLAAVDFWRSLVDQDGGDNNGGDNGGDNGDILSFASLTADALAPFKHHAMLVMNSASGWVIRFVGDKLSPIVGPAYTPAVNLSGLAGEALTPHIQKLLEIMTGSPGFYGLTLPGPDAHTELLGTMIPLTNQSDTGFNFVLFVMDTHDRSDQEAPHAAPAVLRAEVMEALDQSRALSSQLTPAASNHQHLYGALATTLKLYEIGLDYPADIKSLLADQKLKVQERAPFTPLLKLVFGKDYDKTRLTEYAAALSYAWRQGISSDGLADYLKDVPGGIKGCVKEERTHRRAQRGSFSQNQLDICIETLKAAPTVPLEDLNPTEDLSLAVVRKTDSGTLEVIAPYEATPSAMETAIRKTARLIKAELTQSTPPTSPASPATSTSDEPTQKDSSAGEIL